MVRNKYFDLYWENPLKTYNKIKKYFKPLKPIINIDFCKSNCAKILEIHSFDVLWKDKWNSPRHEFNPRILISIFNYLHIRIDFTIGEDSIHDMVYWEAALWWLYYNKPLHKAFKYSSGWSDYDEKTNSYKPMSFHILKEPWQSMYNNKTLKKIMYENTTR